MKLDSCERCFQSSRQKQRTVALLFLTSLHRTSAASLDLMRRYWAQRELWGKGEILETVKGQPTGLFPSSKNISLFFQPWGPTLALPWGKVPLLPFPGCFLPVTSIAPSLLLQNTMAHFFLHHKQQQEQWPWQACLSFSVLCPQQCLEHGSLTIHLHWMAQ